MSKQLTETVAFDFIRYANCWEDCDVLQQGLNVTAGSKVISIASAGDNSFSFLATDNVEVHGVDVNDTQIHLCNFKKTAIQYLDYIQYMQLMGFVACNTRSTIFESIKNYLPAHTLVWCNSKKMEIENGIIFSGKFEKYFEKFRKYILPLVHNTKTVQQLFVPKSQAAQTNFYNNIFNTWRWRFLFKIFFSKFVMGRAGRDPVFLDQVKISVGDYIFAQAQNHLCSEACQQNYFLQFIFTGKFNAQLPHYIRPQNFEKIKANIANITFSKGYVQDVTLAKPNYFTHANLSNIFEYMDESTFDNLSQSLHISMAANAKLAYWNLMVDRDLAITNATLFTTVYNNVSKTDNGFFYKAFKTSIKL